MPGKHSRNHQGYPIKDEPMGHVPGKRNIAYGLADILEKDLLNLRNIFYMDEGEEAETLALVIRKLIRRWYRQDIFWGGNRDLCQFEDLVKMGTKDGKNLSLMEKDRERNKKGIKSVFQWIGEERYLGR